MYREFYVKVNSDIEMNTGHSIEWLQEQQNPGEAVAKDSLSDYLTDKGIEASPNDMVCITADGCDGEYVSYTVQADNTNYDVVVVWRD